MRMQIEMNVPLEFVEAAFVDGHYFDEPIRITGIEYDEYCRLAVVTVEADESDVERLRWIVDDDIAGIPI
jgi:hypothetical protein